MSATVSPQPGPTQLEGQVADFVDQTVDFARTKGREDLVTRLCEEAHRTDRAAVTVVVAGEAKRGKSSLVNALLSMDLSPVDAAPATNAHIVFQHAPSTRVRVFHDGAPLGEDIAPDDLPAWVTATGNPQNARHVRSVEIGLDHPLLAQGLVLVDTPGVGGLEASHADVTLAALATADVLVFVLDASAPISGQELAFLIRVTERIGNVLFVLTKIDAYAGSDEIAAEDRALLERTRFARTPVFAVSSTRKRKADEARASNSELADTLRTLSGFDEFESALLTDAIGRASILRLANVVQLGRIVLDRLDESEQAVIEGAKGNSRHKEELEAARRRVQELADTRRMGGPAVADQFASLQDALEAEFERALLDLEHRSRPSEPDKATLEALPERLDAELNALMARLNASLAEGVSKIVVDVAATLALEGLGTIDVASADLTELSVPTVSLMPPREAVEAVFDTTRAMGGMYVPDRLLGGLAAVLFGVGTGAIVGVVAGLAVIGVTVVKGGRVRNQQQAEALLAEAIRTARREIPSVLRARVRELRREVEQSVHHAIKRRKAELGAAIREHEQMACEDARTRNRAAAAASDRLAILKQLHQQADELMTALAAAKPEVVSMKEADAT